MFSDADHTELIHSQKCCLLANSHGSVKRRRRKSVPGRRASVSSDKGQVKDEDTVPLPDVEEGSEVKQSHNGVEEGVEIWVYTCGQFIF